MLQIHVDSTELFNDDTSEFINVPATDLQLEHSLLSISKWEAEYEKPFLKSDLNIEELLFYIKCMTINQNVNQDVYLALVMDGKNSINIKKIQDYIKAKRTATHITNRDKKVSNRIVTSEQIYYWMTCFNIPVEFQKWHLNRLLTLIEICSVENNPDKKKMSKQEIYNHNAEINERNRKRFHSKG